MLSSGIPEVHPLQTLGFKSTADANNIVHDLVDGRIAITFRDGGLRKGTLSLLFDDEATAAEAETMLRTGSVFLFDDPARPTMALVFVVVGSVTRELDTETGVAFLVAVDYQEIAA